MALEIQNRIKGIFDVELVLFKDQPILSSDLRGKTELEFWLFRFETF